MLETEVSVFYIYFEDRVYSILQRHGIQREMFRFKY